MAGTIFGCGTTLKRTLMAATIYALTFSSLVYILGVLIFPEMPGIGGRTLSGYMPSTHIYEPFDIEDLRGTFLFELGKAILFLAPFSSFLGKKLNQRKGAFWFVPIAGLFAGLFSEFAMPHLIAGRIGYIIPIPMAFSSFLALLAGTSAAFAYWRIAMKDLKPSSD